MPIGGQCVATNDFTNEAWEIFTIYNGRAKIEKTIEELKNDYNLGGIVTQKFSVNDAITQMTLIAHQMLSYFRRNFMDKVHRNCRLATLRTILLNVPARILTSARRTWTRVYNRLLEPQVYARILARLGSFRSTWFLEPASSTS